VDGRRGSLGYRVEDRALRIVENHTEIVRSLFRSYLGAGSVVRLKQQLESEEVRIPIRIDGGGRSTGGGLFSRGHIYKILSNPIYVGRIAHKGELYDGHHPPIVTLDLWDEVQQSLGDHLGAARTKRTRQSSDALLIGKLYDDGGRRMTPIWARKGSKRWRYYVFQAALQGDKSKAASILRVPAADVEELVAEAVGKLSLSDASLADIRNLIDRVVISHATIRIQRSEVAEENDSARILTLPWTRPSDGRIDHGCGYDTSSRVATLSLWPVQTQGFATAPSNEAFDRNRRDRNPTWDSRKVLAVGARARRRPSPSDPGDAGVNHFLTIDDRVELLVVANIQP
jgi:hypothetical protein